MAARASQLVLVMVCATRLHRDSSCDLLDASTELLLDFVQKGKHVIAPRVRDKKGPVAPGSCVGMTRTRPSANHPGWGHIICTAAFCQAARTEMLLEFVQQGQHVIASTALLAWKNL